MMVVMWRCDSGGAGDGGMVMVEIVKVAYGYR